MLYVQLLGVFIKVPALTFQRLSPHALVTDGASQGSDLGTVIYAFPAHWEGPSSSVVLSPIQSSPTDPVKVFKTDKQKPSLL